MKSILKSIILILIILILLFSLKTEVFGWSEVIQNGRDFLQQADPDSTGITASEMKDVSGYLYNILLGAGVVIAVIVATILGVQFMIEGAEGQAKIKEAIVPFIVGCIIVFGGFAFWKIAISVGDALEKATGSGSEVVRDESGESVCSNCGDPVTRGEWSRGVCSNCGKQFGN